MSEEWRCKDLLVGRRFIWRCLGALLKGRQFHGFLFCKGSSQYCPWSGLGRFWVVWPSSFVVRYDRFWRTSCPCSWCLSTKLNGVSYQQAVNLTVTCRGAGVEVQSVAVVPPWDSGVFWFFIFNDSANQTIIRQCIVRLIVTKGVG